MKGPLGKLSCTYSDSFSLWSILKETLWEEFIFVTEDVAKLNLMFPIDQS